MSSTTQMPDHWALEFLQLNDMALGFRDRLEKAEAENAKLRELAGGTRTARRVIVSDPSTDCATGHCECGGCGGAVDPWDAWCRHCGSRLEDE